MKSDKVSQNFIQSGLKYLQGQRAHFLDNLFQCLWSFQSTSLVVKKLFLSKVDIVAGLGFRLY